MASRALRLIDEEQPLDCLNDGTLELMGGPLRQIHKESLEVDTWVG